MDGTQACQQHEREWLWYQAHYNHQKLSGFWWMVCRPGERLPWEPVVSANEQPHDEDAVEVQRSNYFTPQ
jgi:hypothetical protein